MTILDDIQAQKRLDPENLYSSITALAQQCRHAWQECQKIALPDSYRRVNKILFSGMGGSGLGPRIIESVYGDKIKLPLLRVNDYDLPSWVDKRTLVICSSYSGTTEETVSTAHQAQKKALPWIAIGSGGSLIDLAKKSRVPYYQIVPTYNPSKQPRMTVGYQVVSQLVLTAKIGLFTFTADDLESIVKTTSQLLTKIKRELPVQANPAKKLARKVFNHAVILVSGRHLIGASHTVKNQMNENAKNFSASFEIPELNHHLMEGLTFPKSNQKELFFWFIDSGLYPARIRQRFSITREVVAKNKISSFSWQAKSASEISQAFELIQFGSMVNFYLAMLNQINPVPIQWVDYFKTKLGQPLGPWK